MINFRIKKTYVGYIPKKLKPHQIVQFGSNPEGKHGAGNALFCLKYHGAIYGKARGLMGNSYGIVTTDLRIKGRPNVAPENIINEIHKMYKFALDNPSKEIFVAYTGDSPFLLSGFKTSQLAKMYLQACFNDIREIPENIIFEDKFYDLVYA